MDPSRFHTHSLDQHHSASSIRAILNAALTAVEPAAAVQAHLRRDGDTLFIGNQTYPLQNIHRIFVVGAGKAGLPMAQAAYQVLGVHINAGLVIVKDGHHGGLSHVGPIEIVQAAHPVPDARSIAAAGCMVALLDSAGEHDLVIVFISGGGSALLTLPVPSVPLEAIAVLTSQLLACGAAIQEVNTLRKHLSQVKGGQLRRWAAPAHMAALILSDVVGNPLDIIASGPTVPDPGTFADAAAVLHKYDLWGTAPPEVRTYIEKGLDGNAPETPKPGDPIFDHALNILVGSNEIAAQAALTQAQVLGFHTEIITNALVGEAREQGVRLAKLAVAHQQNSPSPFCLIAGGETTVTILGDGLGGRNQELALAAVPILAGHPLLLITLATDGGDGPTDAAGAVVTGDSLSRAQGLGLDVNDTLARNDSYNYFSALDDLLKTGPTHTNVNDLVFIFGFP